MPGVEVRLPMKKAAPLDGVISYLTAKHRGNVHEKGIVTISAEWPDLLTPSAISVLMLLIALRTRRSFCGRV
jgi:hypothetical protein